jgi:4-hydroxybenzoate polyprenyltransferase
VLDVVGLGGGFAASYTAGMFLNDAFDRHFDARHRPDRPIPALRLTAAEVFGAGFALLAFGAGLTVLVASRHGHALAGAAGALALSFAIVLYDVWHKGNPLAPLVMGACRGLVYLAAVLGLTGTLDPLAIVAALAMVAYVAGLTDVARSKGAPPVRGAVALGVAPIVLAAASLVVGRSVLGALAAAALATVAAAALRHAKDGHGERAVVLLLAGLSLVDATLLASTGHPLLGVAAVVAMPLTRKLQAFVRGT